MTANNHGSEKQPITEEAPKENASTPILQEPQNETASINELQRLKEEAAEFKDKYLRLLAEADNARKRLQKDRQEGIQRAVEDVIIEFLNPIDHMENALGFTQHMSEDVKQWATGFQMILSQFKEVLTTHGVQAFNAEGAPFDPHSHEAVEVIETNDHAPGTVVKQSLKGYKMGDRTIRVARVTVAKPVDASTDANI